VDNEGAIENEEYRCEKCGAVFSMQVQNNGKIEYDEGSGCCEKCYKFLCKDCGKWYTYGGRYGQICESCFKEELLDSFAEWHDIFQDEFCYNKKDSDLSCDDCIFFFKKGCTMMFIDELINYAFYTKEMKQKDLKRLQEKNLKNVNDWKQLIKRAIKRSNEL
jgi:hypothetical protein